jgi:hypothetical protein
MEMTPQMIMICQRTLKAQGDSLAREGSEWLAFNWADLERRGTERVANAVVCR